MRRKLTDEDIYRKYLGDVIIGEMYNSPIPGRNDDTPSFRLYEKDGRILWKDFGLAAQFGSKPENLVQYLRGIELTPKGYYDAQRMIQKEMFRESMKPPVILQKRRKHEGTPYVRGDFDYQRWEISYWQRFYLDAPFLMGEDVQALRFMNWSGDHDECDLKSTPEDPAFIYWWNRSPSSYKIYRPLTSKRDKFRQEGISGVIEGWNSMMKQRGGEKFEVLFINEASKDRFVVKKAMGDVQRWNAINPRSCTDRQDLLANRDLIFSLAERVISLYDADDPGFKGSRTLSDQMGCEYEDMRGVLSGEKDFSDYVDQERGNHSLNDLRELICDICKL